jgi:methionyl-tRNA formyltransferase
MLNLVLVTQDDPFYIPIFFKKLFESDISSKFNLIGIIIQPPLGKRSFKKLVPQMLNFYGFFSFIILGVKFVIYKLLNFAAVNIFNGKFPGVFSVEHILRKKNQNIIQIKNINSQDSLNFLREMNIDVIFSIAASQIFKKGILELPKLGCYNIHTSKLPKNRGMMPNFWSLYNYDVDPVSAVTIHKMNEALDDGDILLQEEFNLDSKEPLESLIKRTKNLSAEVFLKAINIIDKGESKLSKNDSSKASYNTFPQKEDVKRFKEKRLKLR